MKKGSRMLFFALFVVLTGLCSMYLLFTVLRLLLWRLSP